MTLPDLILTNKQDQTIRSDAFRSITLKGCSRITLDGASVDFTPGADTTVNTPVVSLNQCANITLRGMTIHGNPTLAGTLGSQEPTAVPPPGQDSKVVGFPYARGVNIEQSTGVTLEGCDISGFHRGVLLKTSSALRLIANRIHHNRTTPIGGSASVFDALIEGNWLGDSRSWRSPVGGGDHSDFIHFFTARGQKPVTGLRIINNVLDQGEGQSMLGINLEDAYSVGYEGEITGNVQINGNSQGGSITNFTGPIRGNVFYAPAGSTGFPTLILRGDASKVIIEGNTLYERSAKPFLAATYPGNTYLTRAANVAPLVELARKAARERLAPVVVKPRTVEERLADLEAWRASLTK